MADDIRKYTTEGTPERILERYRSLPARAAQTDFGDFDRNIVVLDTETTGISVRKDELTQIAAARLEQGRIIDWFVTFVNPGRPIPDDVAHLTNIHDEDVADAPDPTTALEQLVAFVGDAKIVAHNAAFDRNFTTKHPAGYPLLENLWIDSLELARIALPRMRSHRLIDLVRAFDAPLSTHRADEDVSATCALYRLLLAGVDAMPAPLVREIARLAPPSEWSTGAIFRSFSDEDKTEAQNATNHRASAQEHDEQETSVQGHGAQLESAQDYDAHDHDKQKDRTQENGARENGRREKDAQESDKHSEGKHERSKHEHGAQENTGIKEDAQNEGGWEAPPMQPFNLKMERAQVAKTVGKPKRDAAKMISAELAARSGLRVSEQRTMATAIASTPYDDDTWIEEDDFGSVIGAGTAVAYEEEQQNGQHDEETPRSVREKDAPAQADAVVQGMYSAADPSSASLCDQSADGYAILEFPTKEEIEAAFQADGLIGALYEDYQQRDEQARMALAVRDAFASSDNLVVEAGTGVGKSMAYLVPAALTAQRNDINVGIATKTNALLDQLIYHELPALACALEHTSGRTLTYASLKGFTHYPCLRKIQRLIRDGARMVTVQGEEQTQAPALAALLSFVQQTDYDDMDSLKIDYRLVPRRAVTSTSHECMRRKCPFFGASCFVHGQRRRAEAADVVVTNHSLLFCDIAADNGLLPPIRYWVLDEAHSAEAEARRALSLELSLDAMNQLAERVTSDGTRNIFVRAERNVTGPAATDENGDPLSATAEADFGTLFFGLCARAKAAGVAFSEAEGEFASHVPDLLFFDTQKKSSYEFTDLWINDEMRRSTIFGALADHARTLIAASEKLVNVCQELVGYLEGAQGAGTIQREIATMAFELKDIITAADTIFVQAPPTYVYSATLPRKADRGGARICAQLYNVGARLDETLYTNTHSVVFASATLTVAGSFKPFEEAMGLNASPQSHATTLELGSPFDFDANMTIYVPNDLPEPNTTGYLEAIQQLLRETHLAQGGSMLTLFTNRKEMDACFAEVAPALKAADLRVVCQRWGVSVKGLRDDFLADRALSLFALKSFWEGFDAPGSTLRGVVLPKLPFAKPSDPLSCERAARDDAAWRKWVLPQSVVEVKQAVGRLLRKADDCGIVVLADSRLLSKSYGRTFLRSLPSRDVRIVSTQQMIDEIAKASAPSDAKSQEDAGQA